LFEGRCPSITPCAVHNLVRKNNVTHLRTVVRVITRIHVVECHEKCTRRLHTG
jgi:predicted metal-dependent hydrolase